MPIMPMSVMVSTYAMGSLLPLSSSNNGRRLFFKFNPLDRRMENTDAESVEDMVDARSKDETKPTPADSMVMPNTYHTAIPVRIAVSKTPKVASTTPWAATGFISIYFVSIPPEKRMIQRATEPMV